MRKTWIFGLLIFTLLLAACSTPPPTQQAPAATEAPGGPAQPASMDGPTLLGERCTVCHDLARVEAKKGSADDWTATVERMLGKGARLNDAEKAFLIDYLAATYPK